MQAARGSRRALATTACLGKRSFGGVSWHPPNYHRDGFPITDHTHPDYDAEKDPFRVEGGNWKLNGPMIEETDWDDPRRYDIMSQIPIQYKSVTQSRAFNAIRETLLSFHRFKGTRDDIKMTSRFNEDLGLDSLDVNELIVTWEYEFNIIGSCSGANGGGDAGGWGQFNDYDVLEWKTVADVVEYVCELPSAMVNVPESPDHDECYEWDWVAEPEWGIFTERVNDDGTIGKPNYNPSGLPEFEHRNSQLDYPSEFKFQNQMLSAFVVCKPFLPDGQAYSDLQNMRNPGRFSTPSKSLVDDH